MFAYKTAAEQAAEWNVTLRHIQYLCRQGKIEGALKRAGVWFIPQDATNPVKNTKADSKAFNFAGTKKKIFENAIKLFTQKGYENVSIHDIAESVGIRQSAVYNHFKSKQDIIETIYSYYYYNSISNRPSSGDIEEVLQTGSTVDIVTKGFIYEFDQSILGQMSDIIKIIMQRVTTDSKASELYKKLMLEEGVNFIETGLNRGVEIGRFSPFDTHTISVIITSIRFYTLLWWLADPPSEIHKKVERDEQAMYAYIARLLPDTNPPYDRSQDEKYRKRISAAEGQKFRSS